MASVLSMSTKQNVMLSLVRLVKEAAILNVQDADKSTSSMNRVRSPEALIPEESASFP